ncbi:AAA-like domain-containing protein [Anaerolineales bacterium HSG24]|nr:AAA-like domain-containing protein [Anaerolineales bacterium HSG24]
MREFNTTGPCNPALHYTVMREALMEVGKEKVNKSKFFTIFAPRQSGKTTYFQLLLERLRDEGYTAIWISFENLKKLTKERFYKALTIRLGRALAEQHNIKTDIAITDALDLSEFFANIKTTPIILIIDEFEGIPDDVLSEVMHTFRQIYHQKGSYRLHSLILVGVSTIAELVVGPASPFNIADELEIEYFTRDEVDDLIGQYVTETGHCFDETVIKTIYENTHGQPGLVCALCNHLVTKVVPDKNQPVTMGDFYPTLQFFLTKHITNNIINIVQKARQKRVFMLKLLFQPQPIPFSMYEPDIAWLHANGVVDDVDGYVDVLVPLYKKVLITAFRPVINGEAEHYLTTARDVLGDYITEDGTGLNVNALLKAYRAYIRRRGFRAFDTENLKEGACHYSLDGYINFFIERLEGQTYIEVPSGRGRTDILIRYRQRTYIIEVKIFSDDSYFKKGKGQLAQYLKSEGLDEGYYVVFSKIHTEDDKLYDENIIEGKRIYTHIIRTKFDRPNETGVPIELKVTRESG